MDSKSPGKMTENELAIKVLQDAFNGSLFKVVDMAMSLKEKEPKTFLEILSFAAVASGHRRGTNLPVV